MNKSLRRAAFRKRIQVLMVMMIILSALLAIPVHAEAVSVTIDGEPLMIPADEPGPYINNQNRTMIPITFVSRELGAQVNWNENDRRVTIGGDNNRVQLDIGTREALVNGTKVYFDTEAVITESRTFVPLRFVSEALGLFVKWDAEERTAAIHTEDSGEVEAVIQSTTEGSDEKESDLLSEPSSASEVVDELHKMAREVVRLTNIERTNRGLDPLDIDVELMKVAESKSRDMRLNRTMAHDSPKYGGLRGLLDYYAVDCQMAAENIARGHRTAEKVVEGWMNSPGHRDNILMEEASAIGVGVVECETGPYWTQLLIS